MLYRLKEKQLQVFLVHPGGPFWKNKDLRAWSIPKGEFGPGEDPLEVAKRELYEETSQEIEGNFIELKPIKQKSGKTVYAWAVEGNIDPQIIKSNTVPIEWPPRSGKTIDIPEVDRGEWFSIEEAKEKINARQAGLLEQLKEKLPSI